MCSLLRASDVLLQEAAEFCLGHGLAVEVALAVIAAVTAQHFFLLVFLDALADDGHAECMAEVDHARENGLHALGSSRGEQQRTVDLHDVERDGIEDREIGVAAAEVVDGQVEAHLVQLVHDVERMLAISGVSKSKAVSVSSSSMSSAP